jgi:hypothetical protein
MAQIYEKSVVELLKDFVNTRSENEGIFTKKDAVNWFKNNYSKIEESTVTAHLILFSTNDKNRIHYSRHSNGKADILFKINEHTYRKYDPAKDPSPIYKETIENGGNTGNGNGGTSEYSNRFAAEEDLKKYLAKNLEIIEPGLKLFDEEGITGLEYNVGGRFIDILAKDVNNNFVVIELKVSKSYDRVIGQLLRYKNWIQKNLVKDNRKVRGIIIGNEISDDLKIACIGLSNIKLYEYELSVKLSEKELENI